MKTRSNLLYYYICISIKIVGIDSAKVSLPPLPISPPAPTTSKTFVHKFSPESSINNPKESYRVNYECSHLQFHEDANKSLGQKEGQKPNAILLIAPIGVGISKWFYDDLLTQLNSKVNEDEFLKDNEQNYLYSVIVPDLLACGSAAAIIKEENQSTKEAKRKRKQKNTKIVPPLLTPKDWADQMENLMRDYQKEYSGIGEIQWNIVSNGGCTPIALEIGKRFVDSSSSIVSSTSSSKSNVIPKIKSIIISAPPGKIFIEKQPPVTKKEKNRVSKSYKTLSKRFVGDLFWWYSFRKGGKFVRSFTVKNLFSSEIALGENDLWTRRCLETGTKDKGISKYSTFMFLSGALQDGLNMERLDVLSSSSIPISVISGRDRRLNRARSVFWERSKKKRTNVDDKNDGNSNTSVEVGSPERKKTYLSSLLQRNGNGGKEIFVGGRKCPAHEDPVGFADALLSLLNFNEE